MPDILVRYERMQGHNVLYPIGFDAFGLPAENAAIKRKLNPRVWTERNIKYMTKQLESMGASFDWSRKVSTTDPAYYRWTQWMFIKMFEKGLAYRAKTPVNWCPKDKTVLANEQVVDGKCERCDSEVVQKEIEQWMFKTTAYAERLLEGLDDVDWPESTRVAQKNWIGKSEGARIRFALKVPGQEDKHAVEVFTTRPDTIFGSTFLVISPELAEQWIKIGWQASEEVKKYVQSSLKKRELDRLQESKEKTGVATGIMAVNPATKKDVPVWIADYVLGSYGTGAIMAVPAHDERDFEFAKRYGLSIKQVVIPSLIDYANPPQEGKENTFRKQILAIVYDPKKKAYLTLVWKKQPWTTFITGGIDANESSVDAARREIREETGYKNVKFLRSMGISEAHFYAAHKGVNRIAQGEHILFELVDYEQDEVSAEEKALHEVVWVSKEELEKKSLLSLSHAENVLLIEKLKTGKDIYVGEGKMINSGEFDGLSTTEAKERITDAVGGTWQATYKLRDWILSRQRYWGVPIPMIRCATCGFQPVKEKELPVLLPKLTSYLPTDDGRSPLAKATLWTKTKCPKCKRPAERETDTMDTFVDSSWYYLRYTDPKNKKVFADKRKMAHWLPVPLYIGGAEHNTMHLLYSRFFAKVLHDLGYIEFDEPFSKRVNHGTILGPNGLKMSKSKGNVVDPDVEVKRYGADTIRMYIGFMAPYEQGGPWDPRGIMGVHRFLSRVYALGIALAKEKSKKGGEKKLSASLELLMHQTIQKVGEDISAMKFNTAISSLMILLNAIEKEGGIGKKDFHTFLLLLSPFAPHLTEELYSALKGKGSVHEQLWPAYNPEKLVSGTATIVVQIHGKMRAQVVLPRDTSEADVEKAALELEDVRKWLDGKKVARVIHVKNRLINFVLD
jgi:leucyl-tRNA synthetase